MAIQDVVPLPVNPLATLASDYEHAVLHLAWALHKKTKERTLLFAWVELLPTEVPPPVDDGDMEGDLPAKSDHRVYVRHAVTSAERALRWYLGCRRGAAVLPEDDGTLPADDAHGARQVQLGDLGEEPPWPNLVCVEESDTTVVPFCPQWHACPRVHQLVPLADFEVKKLWPRAQDREKAVEFLSERLHFELAEYPEYWGSVHLVAPNPVFRTLEVRRQPPTSDDGEVVLLRFQRRAERKLDELELSMREDRASGVGALRTVRVQGPTLRMMFDHKTDVHSETVADRTRGMLFAGTTGIFIGAFQSNMSFGPAPTRVVEVPGAEPYEVPLKVQPIDQVSVEWGGNRVPQGLGRLRSAEHHRRERAEAEVQHWFHGAKEEATLALRELLYDAEREVLIVDPYFGAAELFRFLPAVAKIGIPIFVLAATERLKEKVRQGGDTERWEPLLTQFRNIIHQLHAKKISIRATEGEGSAIHDRFIVVDDRVWLLGSSLNEFGSRGTMMVAVPAPTPIRERLFEAWHQASELEAWAVERGERQKSDGVKVCQ